MSVGYMGISLEYMGWVGVITLKIYSLDIREDGLGASYLTFDIFGISYSRIRIQNIPLTFWLLDCNKTLIVPSAIKQPKFATFLGRTGVQIWFTCIPGTRQVYLYKLYTRRPCTSLLEFEVWRTGSGFSTLKFNVSWTKLYIPYIRSGFLRTSLGYNCAIWV